MCILLLHTYHVNTHTHTHLSRTSYKGSAFTTHHCYVAVKANLTPVKSWFNVGDVFGNHPDLSAFLQR